MEAISGVDAGKARVEHSMWNYIAKLSLQLRTIAVRPQASPRIERQDSSSARYEASGNSIPFGGGEKEAFRLWHVGFFSIALAGCLDG